MAWLGLFDTDPGMLATGAAYLRVVGPSYGLFGLGLCLYFASQAPAGCFGRCWRGCSGWCWRSAAAGSPCG